MKKPKTQSPNRKLANPDPPKPRIVNRKPLILMPDRRMIFRPLRRR